MKRKPLPPDTRLNWRDPEMPCYAHSISKGMILITPDRLQKVSQYRMQSDAIPDYTSDPTYNLRKDRK